MLKLIQIIKMDTSVFREPEEPQETIADADPHIFASSGYF